MPRPLDVVGRVAGVDSCGAEVDTPSGAVRATWGAGVLAAAGSDTSALPCPGDAVVVRRWPDRRLTVESVCPRSTLLTDLDLTDTDPDAQTRAGRRRGRALAANMDVVAVVEALAPAPDRSRLERHLRAARSSGAAVVVLLTKADLVADATEWAARVRAWADGAEVVVTSCVTGQGLHDVRALLRGRRTVTLLGSAGGGTTGLVEAIGRLPRPASPQTAGLGALSRLHVVAGGALIQVRVPGAAVCLPWPRGYHRRAGRGRLHAVPVPH